MDTNINSRLKKHIKQRLVNYNTEMLDFKRASILHSERKFSVNHSHFVSQILGIKITEE